MSQQTALSTAASSLSALLYKYEQIIACLEVGGECKYFAHWTAHIYTTAAKIEIVFQREREVPMEKQKDMRRLFETGAQIPNGASMYPVVFSSLLSHASMDYNQAEKSRKYSDKSGMQFPLVERLQYTVTSFRSDDGESTEEEQAFISSVYKSIENYFPKKSNIQITYAQK